MAYLVGERGKPELFVPDQAGHIMPMETVASLRRGGRRQRDRRAARTGAGQAVVQINISTPDVESFRRSRAPGRG